VSSVGEERLQEVVISLVVGEVVGVTDEIIVE
jgi:hypothetical protein